MGSESEYEYEGAGLNGEYKVFIFFYADMLWLYIGLVYGAKRVK